MSRPEVQVLIEQFRTANVLALPSVTAMRAAIDEIGRLHPVPDDVSREAVTIGSINAEWIKAPAASDEKVLLYFHGGGYVIGSIDSHRELIARLSRKCMHLFLYLFLGHARETKSRGTQKVFVASGLLYLHESVDYLLCAAKKTWGIALNDRHNFAPDNLSGFILVTDRAAGWRHFGCQLRHDILTQPAEWNDSSFSGSPRMRFRRARRKKGNENLAEAPVSRGFTLQPLSFPSLLRSNS